MKQKSKFLKQGLLVFGLMVAGLTLFSWVPVGFAQLIQSTDNPQNVSAATGGEESLRSLILTIINYFLFFLGLLATIMVIYGGIMYVTAAGEQDKVDSAKKVITYALIGIVVILLSFALVRTVIGAGLGNEAST